MGLDGAYGLLAMRHAGASTFIQDEHSSLVFGMPRAALEMGAADKQVPLDGISRYVTGLFSVNDCVDGSLQDVSET
jgi:chemotaxis response regulator CheB